MTDESMSAREWWIDLVSIDPTMSDVYNKPEYDDLIHVREVTPGSVTITREMLRESVMRCINAQGGLSTDKQWSQLERELFGPEQDEG